jgi:hypothetical protein
MPSRRTSFTARKPWNGDPHMTLDEARAVVEATLDSPHLRVDLKRARQDATSYLLIVLDKSNGQGEGPVANGPRLVDKRTAEVIRLTVPDALARAERMALVRS